jgi:hypothetical protein
LEVISLPEIHHFLSYLTGPKSTKISLLIGAGTILGALFDALFSVNIMKIFTGEILKTGELLRLGYDGTLILIGYLVLLFGLLRSVFSTLRDTEFKTHSKRLLIQFVILCSFIISFSIARTFVILLDVPINPEFQLWLKGYRIHHFFFGIGLLIIGGWLGHIQSGQRMTLISAGLYGSGFGFVVDEFGLLLTFGDYWLPQSYLFFVIFSLFLLIMLLFEAYKIVNTSSTHRLKNAPHYHP